MHLGQILEQAMPLNGIRMNCMNDGQTSAGTCRSSICQGVVGRAADNEHCAAATAAAAAAAAIAAVAAVWAASEVACSWYSH